MLILFSYIQKQIILRKELTIIVQYFKQHQLSGKFLVSTLKIGILLVRKTITEKLPVRRVITVKSLIRIVKTDKLLVRMVITGKLPVRRIISGNFPVTTLRASNLPPS